jgi:hypothetical protein
MSKNNNTIKDWIYGNSWNLLITFTGIVIGFALLNARVDANATTIYALQMRLDKYPSEQYFDLKFKTQEEKLNALEKKIDDINIALNKHLQGN